MKKVVVCVLLIGSLFSAIAANAAGPVVIQLGHDLPEETPQHLGSVKFKEIVERKSEGNMTVEIFPAGELGDDVEAVELLQVGAVQASLIPTAKLSGFEPSLQIVDLPFLFPSKKVCYCVLDSEVGDKLLAGLEDIGLQGMAFWESGFKQFTANRPIRTPETYEGLTIRVMQSPILIEQFKAMGADAIPIAFSEVYNALQQGVVDGQENPLVSITKMKFHEVQSHVILSNHGYLGYAFLFSKIFWDGLDTQAQEILRQASIEAAQYERELTAEMEEGFLKTIVESGTEVIRLTEDERKAFEEATRPVHQKFVDVIGKDVLNMVYEQIDTCAQ